MTDTRALIDQLQLSPHPEGGWFRETWRADAAEGERAAATAIYFLLEASQRSHWHKVDADETWLWHAGDPLLLSLAVSDEGPVREVRLGPDVLAGDAPQLRRHAARMAGRRAPAGRTWLYAGIVRGRTGVRIRRVHAGPARLAAGGVTRTTLRWLLAWLYAVAGYFHLTTPEPFLRITPAWVPMPQTVIMLTGIAEFAGAAALLQPWSPWLRKAGGIGLALYALCVWPANVNHMLMDLARPDQGWGLAYHVPRMIAQPLLIWLALWTSGTTDWPVRPGIGSSA